MYVDHWNYVYVFCPCRFSHLLTDGVDCRCCWPLWSNEMCFLICCSSKCGDFSFPPCGSGGIDYFCGELDETLILVHVGSSTVASTRGFARAVAFTNSLYISYATPSTKAEGYPKYTLRAESSSRPGRLVDFLEVSLTCSVRLQTKVSYRTDHRQMVWRKVLDNWNMGRKFLESAFLFAYMRLPAESLGVCTVPDVALGLAAVPSSDG